MNPLLYSLKEFFNTKKTHVFDFILVFSVQSSAQVLYDVHSLMKILQLNRKEYVWCVFIMSLLMMSAKRLWKWNCTIFSADFFYAGRITVKMSHCFAKALMLNVARGSIDDITLMQIRTTAINLKIKIFMWIN